MIRFDRIPDGEGANCNSCIRGTAEFRLQSGAEHHLWTTHLCGDCAEALVKVAGMVVLPELFEGMPEDEVPHDPT